LERSLNRGRTGNLKRNFFTEEELKTMNAVAKRFAGKKTGDIVELSHKEKGWLENEKNRDLISYKYAFYLLF